MKFVHPDNYINIHDYEYVVSLGNKCPTTLILRQLNLYNESFPFDYIPTTPALILKYLQDTSEFFPEKNEIVSKDGVWFGHFDTTCEKYDETVETLNRRFNRLINILENKSKILFVYTSEADVYNELNNRYNNNFNELCKIQDYIIDTYKYDNFSILAIHTNKCFDNTKNIINYTINVPEQYLSDDMSTHIPKYWGMYRTEIESLLKKIFTVDK